MTGNAHSLKNESFRLSDNMYVSLAADIIFDALVARLNRAQYLFDSQIMSDMVPYMPHYTGTFINNTRARSQAIAGSGQVVAAAPPMGRFLYYGKVMVGQKTGSPWAQKGERKIVTERPLNYSNPNAKPEWFEVTKQKRLPQWINLAAKNI